MGEGKIMNRPSTTVGYKNRWAALYVLCGGTLMIVLDSTIVNVALPSIRESLHFSESQLAWVVNAYLLTFGGFLLLGGRLGDLFGPRKMFMAGLVLFTVASVLCGLSDSQALLVFARAIQGLGGAVVSAVGLSLTMNLFTESGERARAMGIFGFVASGGGSIGVLLGGILTSAFNWHWIFLVNLPVGILVFLLALHYLPAIAGDTQSRKHLDVAGAVSVTAALLTATYAVINGNAAGWTSLQTLGTLGIAAILLGIFITVESKAKHPLMPLSLFRVRNVKVANAIGVLWAAAMFAWFFIAALYLQLVLGYNPLHVGLAFLPANLIMAFFSISLSAKLVMRYGIKKLLSIGLLIAAVGLALFAHAPVHGHFLTDVLPSMLLLGIGAGMAFNPVLLAAMNDVPPHESGLASGIVNTSFMMGGALGLAVLASVSAAHTKALSVNGSNSLEALAGGYHLAFLLGGLFAALASLIGASLLLIRKDSTGFHAEPVAEAA
jgi:EmrB/QacA subfamily drug resistance transporter